MPFINAKVSVPLNEQKREAIKTAFGQSISVMEKGESYLMVGFEDEVPLYFSGEKQEKCAFVEIKVFGELDPDQASSMTEFVCKTMDMVLGIPGDRVYVTYQGISDWGWNGRNF